MDIMCGVCYYKVYCCTTIKFRVCSNELASSPGNAGNGPGDKASSYYTRINIFSQSCFVFCLDIQVWSKLESGRLPSLPEMKELVEPQFDPPAAATAQINLDAVSA